MQNNNAPGLELCARNTWVTARSTNLTSALRPFTKTKLRSALPRRVNPAKQAHTNSTICGAVCEQASSRTGGVQVALALRPEPCKRVLPVLAAVIDAHLPITTSSEIRAEYCEVSAREGLRAVWRAASRTGA